MLQKENQDREKRMQVSMYNSCEIRRRRVDGARERHATQTYDKQLLNDEY